MSRGALAAGYAIALLASGCSSSGSSDKATSSSGAATSSVASSSGVSCPAPGAAAAWPKEAPAGLPQPPGLAIESIQRTPNIVVHFSVPDDFHTTVRYLLDALPSAGFTLGTGDSEAEEADIPFSKGADRASIKVNDQGNCQTSGLLAIGSD